MPRALLSLLVTFAITSALRAQDAPAPPDKAAAQITVPEGFRVTLCASEPTVIKPIAMTIDDRGRVWVVESHSYPKWQKDGKAGTDRILIFEDTKGAGRFDSCTVFWDKGANLSGIALGFGGVWLCATPNLLFIPVKPGEDKPAGPPVVVLDGWSLRAQHNVFNALTWGPDGWLYGCNGITDTSRVGKPGIPDKERIPLNCGVWRYHPIKKQFEPYAWGTTNPWGLDFDDYGEMFITNCVIKHLWHVVPGAHFQRMHGQDLNPHVYGLMESCADHRHWAGGDWGSSRGGQGAHGESGGGHAHVGAMVYLGDNWPDDYRQKIFMCNLHGLRVNQDILERKGSGYVAHHGKDFLFSKDPWFRGLALAYGPDGGVYMTDWSDTGECHNYDKVHPAGRIFKITYGQPKQVTVDLAKLSDEELARLQLHKNDWYVRQARRLLQERTEAGKLTPTVRPVLQKMLQEQAGVTRKLRALWALYAIGAADEKMLLALLDNPQESLRVWAVRLLVNDRQAAPAVTMKFAQLAKSDPSASVRLALASASSRWCPPIPSGHPNCWPKRRSRWCASTSRVAPQP
jgi:putative membrane-bound dehydrogenase-like protein